MPVDTGAIIELLQDIARDENLKVTFKEAGKGCVIAGAATLVGGIMLGPVGFPLGALVGGAVAYATSKKFKPLVEVISTMDPGKKNMLADRVRGIMNKLDMSDVMLFAALLSRDQSVRQEVIKTLTDYVGGELAMAVSDR